MNKLILKHVRTLWVLIIIVLLQACYPSGSVPITDLDTTSTFYNTVDLATPPTSAAIVWQVSHFELGDGDDLRYNGQFDSDILNTTLQELVKLYGEENVVIISESDTPVPTPVNSNVSIAIPSIDPVPNVDVLFSPGVLLRVRNVTVIHPGMPWWGGGWGWGGWWGFPPTISTRSFEIGSVIIEMFDIRKIPEGGPIPTEFTGSWLAVLRGLLANNPASNNTRIVSGVQQAFLQSTYLN
jgi:uncharacterized protein DUF4136